MMPERMTKAQCEQVFALDHIRTAGEQRAWIESQVVEQSEPVAMSRIAGSLPWEVKGGQLIIRTPMTLTARDIKRIMREIKI